MTADSLTARLLQAAPARKDERGTPGATTSEQGSVAAVYDAHVDYVYRCLRSLGVDPSSLDDAVQDVFIVVHRKLASFNGASQLRTWIYAIAINVARRYRAQRARGAVDTAPELESHLCTERAVAERQALSWAREALDALDAEKREVFVLAEIEQMSAPEIAEVLAIPVNTVYSRLRAARLAFSQKIARRNAMLGRKP
jgi:RNA polymerase sigma-70 factor (ECF subfamily)